MEFWSEVRREVLTGELSKRAACRKFSINFRTLQKILRHEEPPGYQQKEPRRKPKLEPFLPIIHEILKSDRKVHRKQRHTARSGAPRHRGRNHARGTCSGHDAYGYS